MQPDAQDPRAADLTRPADGPAEPADKPAKAATTPVEPADEDEDQSRFASASAAAGAARREVAGRIERSDWLEIIAATLLALATIGSAWAAYQATRWTGVQATEFGEASSLRSESVRADNIARSQIQIDVATFSSWLDAIASEEDVLAEFYRLRFRDEFKPAFEAWLSSVPSGQIPDGTPFTRSEYQVAAQERANELEAQASAAFNDAKDANQTSDNFILTAVVFASVLFFAGVGTKFKSRPIQRILIAMASVMFVVALAVVFSLPQNVGF